MPCAGVSGAQIITMQKNGDKTIYCERSGLSSDLKDCGVRADWYSYVFVGSISAITAAENDEKKLRIEPEEIFHGNPPSSMTVMTSQAACLPKLAVGDHWLFFLRKENGKPMVLDYGGNDSLPVTEAKKQIETLRRLETIGDNGIVRGRVWHYGTDGEPVDHALVVAHEQSGDQQFTASTGADGRYEFSLLPAGTYKITVDPVGSFRPDDEGLEVSSGRCWDLTLTQRPQAQISGYVRYSNGAPVAGAGALIMPVDESWWSTIEVGTNGSFQFGSLKAGNYIIGILLPGDPPWEYASASGEPPPPASLYYPGVPVRSAAESITLRPDQKRDDIVFTIPAQ